MKKRMRMYALLSAALLVLPTVSACGGLSDGEEKIDKNRTQLYVFAYNGGYGTDWLKALKARYEEEHKNDVYEEGKKGIQIVIRAQKEETMANRQNIPSNREEVYFTEFSYYYTLKNEGYLADITDAVTGDLGKYNDGDESGVTIESKMTEQQREFYGIEENGQTHYYAIPHYSGFDGISYDAELFEKRGYYFVDGYDTKNYERLSDLFVYEETDKKSLGPDGKTGIIDGVDYSLDDGLPATYEDFFLLCQYIQSDKNTPIVWNGYAYQSYLNYIVHALSADYDGLEQAMLNFTLNGEATSLGTIQNGKFVLDEEPTAITNANAAEISRQAGKYYALTFLEELLRGDAGAGKYYDSKCLNTTYDHITAQSDFVWGGYDNSTKPTGMLIDGIWWENEAQDAFQAMEDSGAAKKADRKFAFMPYPKATEEKVGSKNVLVDKIYSISFVKKGIADWKLPIAIDFLKYANTQESLVEFTVTTNTPKALNYTLGEADKAKLSNFGRSVIELKERSDVLYPISTNDNYVRYPSEFQTHGLFWSTIGSEDLSRSCYAFKERKTVTAESYFTGMYKYYKKQWSVFA